MHIHRIHLERYICHEDLEVNFTPGINGIIGNNGSGKSALLDALRFLVTGQTVNDGSKTDNILWGADSARVSGVFSHGGVEYEMSRQLGKRSLHRLKTPDYEYIKQAEIEKFLTEITGTTTDAFLNHIFVPQGAIDRILFSTDTQRLKEFQHTVGLQRAAESEAALGKEIHRYRTTPGLREQLKAMQASLADVEAAQADIGTRQGDLETEVQVLQPFRDLLAKETQLKQRNAAITQADERLRKVTERLETALNALEAKRDELASMQELVGTVEGVAESAQERLLEYRAAVKAQEGAKTLETKMVKVSADLEQMEYDDSAVDEELTNLTAQAQKLRSNVELREAQLAGKVSRPELPEEADLKAHRDEITQALQTEKRLESGEEAILRHEIKEREAASEGICPVCTSEPTVDLSESIAAKRLALATLKDSLDSGWEQRRTKLREELASVMSQLVKINESCMIALKGSLDKARKELQSVSARQTELEAARTKYAKLSQEREFLKTQLAAVQPVTFDPSEMEECERVVTEYHNLKSGLTNVSATIAANESEVERCKEDALAARKEREELGDVGELPTQQEIQEARVKTEALAVKEKERREILDELASLDVKHQHFSALVEQLTTQIDAEAAESAWIGVCKRAREVLHVNGLPYLMMREYAAKINRRMRHYLSIWEAPFTIKLGDNLAFIAEYPDGRIHSAARLSGGQRIVASTSFRLAMADLVAGQIGLLVLDEPSNCLDKDNKVHLQQLLLKLKDYAGSTGKQVILVTHEERLRGFFDNVINFGLEV